MKFRRTILTVVSCLLASGLLADRPAVRAQEVRATFRTAVALVPITAVVRDSRNRLVRNLARNDFHVLENSQPRRIVDFKATDDGPVSVALVVDTSGSMRGTNWQRGKEVVDQLLHWITQPADEIALFTFDKTLRQDTPYTGDPDCIRRALENADAWGQTSLYDAIADAARGLASRRAQRRALIVITDGLDNSSTLSASEVSGIASAIDVPVYAISIVPPTGPRTTDEGEGGLASLAYWTGGDVSYVVSPEETPRTLGALMTELRHQYFLAIESDTMSGWHRLDVKTTRRGLTVRARSGYFGARETSGTSGE